MSKEYQCIADAAAIIGFNMPAMQAGTHADIQSFTQAGETVAKGTFTGENGSHYELVTRSVPGTTAQSNPHYFAGVNVGQTNGAVGTSSTSMTRNKAAFQKLLSCIPSG